MPRDMRLADVTTGDDGLPLIGTPLGRRQVEAHRTFKPENLVTRETFKMGKFVGWHNRERRQPIIEYPDGTREALHSMSETNWKTI